MLVDFDMWGQQGVDIFTRRNVITGILARKFGLKLKPLCGCCLQNKHKRKYSPNSRNVGKFLFLYLNKIQTKKALESHEPVLYSQ